MKVIQVRIPKKIVDKIDELVSEGYYSSRSAYIRDKLRDIFK